MSDGLQVMAREVPCPACGYDLRGAVRVEGGRRCSECRTVWRGGRVSRVPWVWRRKLGRVKAYVRTVWMVLRRPWELAREVEGPVGRRDAARFEFISRVVATVVGTGMVGVGFGTARVLARFEFRVEEGPSWLAPWVAAEDGRWALPVVAVGIYVGLGMVMGGYRWMYCLGERGIMRQRMGRVASYVSAVWPLQVLLLGPILGLLRAREFIAEGALADFAYWLEPVWEFRVRVALAVVPVLLFLWPTLPMILGSGRFKGSRATMIMLIYPVMATGAFAGAVLTAVWVAGYAAMMIWSMMH